MSTFQTHAISHPETGASLLVDVEVTYYFVQKPLGPSADSDYDCYGYTELEYDIVRVFNEDDEIELPLNEIFEDLLYEKVKEEMANDN